MSASIAHPASPLSRQPDRRSAHWPTDILRASLLLGCLASVVAAAWLGEPSASLKADPELALMLRGMAAIKGTIVVSVVGVLLWRFGHALPNRAAAACLAGAWCMTGATVLVWQLSFIPLAALVFHVGEFVLLVTAWREHRSGLQPARTAG